MNQPFDKEDYLVRHLSNELHWLLRSATEWYVQRELKLEIDGYNVQVYSMDSCFLHARSLFEFLTKKSGKNNKSVCDFGCTKPLQSELYLKWIDELHKKSMHLQTRDRIHVENNQIPNLNEMPLDFSKEIVRLWREFIDHLNGNVVLQTKAIEVLNEAMKGAKAVENSEVTKCHSTSKAIVIDPILWE